MSLTLAVINLALAAYNAGSMWTLQLMHYPLYALIGPEDFRRYIVANNKRALAPAIVPGLSAVAVAVALVVRARGMPTTAVAIAILVFDLGVLISSGRLQARLHAELAKAGRDQERIARLVSTNWIRTVLNTLAAAGAIYLVLRADQP